MGAPIVHIEFKSADFERTAAFYARLFDWRTEKNASSSYMKLAGSDGPSAGWVRADLVQSPGPNRVPHRRRSRGQARRGRERGWASLVRSLPFAGGGEVALFADPDGNVLGLWRRKPAAPAEAKAGVKAEAKTEAKTEAEAKAESKTEAKTESKAARPGAKPAPKPAGKAKKK